jgi:hypothetical protein
MCMIGTNATVLCFCLFWSESLQMHGTLVMHGPAKKGVGVLGNSGGCDDQDRGEPVLCGPIADHERLASLKQ